MRSLISDPPANAQALDILLRTHNQLWILSGLGNPGHELEFVVGSARSHAGIVAQGHQNHALGCYANFLKLMLILVLKMVLLYRQ
jgi:hypothetical protein